MKKQIKQQHPDLDISLIDILAIIDPSETNKYLPFLIKQLSENLKAKDSTVEEYNMTKKFEHFQLNNFIQIVMYRALSEFGFDQDKLRTLQLFHEFSENNRIKQKDIGQYENFTQIEEAVSEAMFELENRKKEKCIYILLDTPDYLFLKPLTYEASIKYGYATKWCTASISTKNHWTEYAKNGSLTYCFNRKTKEKMAIHMWRDYGTVISGWRDLSFWTSTDLRMDSSESGFDVQVVKKILFELKKDKRTNEEIALEMGLGEYNYEESRKGQETQPPYLPNANQNRDDMIREEILNPEEKIEPIKQEDSWDKLKKRFKSIFRKKKNIFIFNSGNICDEHVEELYKKFYESNLSRTHELVMFPNMEMISFDGI